MKEVYDQLLDAINNVSMVIKFSKIDEIYPMLETMFPMEHAKMGSKMLPCPQTAEQIAENLGKDVEETTSILEEMANNGTVFSTDSGEKTTYMLIPLLPGSWEIQLMKGEKDEKSRKLAKYFEDYFKAVEKTPSRGMKSTKVPFARVIPIAEEIAPNTEVLPYELLSTYLDKVDLISVSHCYCRHEGDLLGNPCTKPIENCFNFGPFAKFLAERGFGRLIGREEAKKKLKEAEEAGLVHCASNTSEVINFVCNCCSCHCGILRTMQTEGVSGMTAASNFIVKLDEDACTGCETCIDRCQVNAMTMGDDIVEINYPMCIGCGLCISTCPTEALSLANREEKVLPPKNLAALSMAQLSGFSK